MHDRENPFRASATEFVTEAFDTTVTERDVGTVAAAISDAVAAFRSKVGDDRLEELLRDGEGSVLRNHHTAENGPMD